MPYSILKPSPMPPSQATLCKTLAISTSVLTILVIFSLSNQLDCLRIDFFNVKTNQSLSPLDTTNVSHLVFGIWGSTKTLNSRKPYIESWWRPNVTRGYLYLETTPTDDLFPWSPNSPPFCIFGNNSKLLEETEHVSPFIVRMVQAVIDLFREEREGARWFIIGDDDTIFFVDNLVDVLLKYDHTKYIYIGGHSECIELNHAFSYEMGFGGAGLVMSYPLMEMVQKNIKDCFSRYPHMNFGDHFLVNCVNDLGVSLTDHQGLHQMDLHGDVLGFLSSHPKAPLLSLHHLDHLDPIFRSMNRYESLKHFIKASNIDQSRLVQQTICYNKQINWSFSVSWGYSVHIYEKVIPRSILKLPLETFKPWFLNLKPPLYIFNTRPLSNDSCETPHVFLFEHVEKINENEVITNYVRMASRGLPTCASADNHSVDSVFKVQVVSPLTKPNEIGKTECCDVEETDGLEVAKVKLRDCMVDELIA